MSNEKKVPAVFAIFTDLILNEDHDHKDAIAAVANDNTKADLIGMIEEIDAFFGWEPRGAYKHWDKTRLADSMFADYNDNTDSDDNYVPMDDEEAQDDAINLDTPISEIFEFADEDSTNNEDDENLEDSVDDDDDDLYWQDDEDDEEEYDDDDEDWDDEDDEDDWDDAERFEETESGVIRLGTPADAGIMASRLENEVEAFESAVNVQRVTAADADDWDPAEQKAADDEEETFGNDETEEKMWYSDLIILVARSGKVNKAKSIEAMVKYFDNVPFTDADGNAIKPTAKQLGELIAAVFAVEHPSLKMSTGYAKAYIDYLVSKGRVTL